VNAPVRELLEREGRSKRDGGSDIRLALLSRSPSAIVFVFIPGPFVPGDAQASATPACGLLVSGFDLGRTIKIVER
jgi:hypothetical protein